MRGKLRKVHIWLGLLFLAPMLLVSATGLLLMHRKGLGLGEIMLKIPGYAAAQRPDPQATLSAGGVTLAAGRTGVYLKRGGAWERTLAAPARRLYAAGGHYYACAADGLYQSPDGARWSAALPGEDARALLFAPGGPHALTAGGIFTRRGGRWEKTASFPRGKLDARDLSSAPGGLLVAAKEGVFLVQAGRMEEEKLPAASSDGRVSLQKLIVDLHTGEFFGSFAWPVVDGGALAMIALCLTGFYLWYPRKK